MYRTLVEAVLAHGKDTPEKKAVAFRDSVMTYGELMARMRSAAYLLREKYGMDRHDKIAISAVKRPDYVVALLAVQYIGGTAVLLDRAVKETEVEDIFQTVNFELLISDSKPDCIEKHLPLKELYAESGGTEAAVDYGFPVTGDVGEMLFTTGTTGRPKGVMLTYGSLEASMENTWNGIGMREDDRILLPLPLNHSYGMRVLRSALWGGAEVVLQNVSVFARDVETDIKKYGCTAFVSVPATIEMLHRQMGKRFAEVLGTLRYIEIGAGALPLDLRKKMLSELPDTKLHNTWGSTETGGALFLNLSEHPEKITSAGKPYGDIELKVLDASGNMINAHDTDSAGRMALRGRMQMSGYYGMPELTAQTIVDGWLLTNDLVYTDEDGYVYMLGRVDDIINVAGEKVAPVEIERVASEYDGIRECACIGVDDPDGVTGKAPVLYLVPESGFSGSELTKFLAERLERYKLPKRYVLVETLPRNHMQKLDRKKIQQMWSESGDKALTNEVIRCLMERRSIRDFTDEPVPRTLLDVITRAGVYAPCGRNMQTWRFTVIRSRKRIAEFKETAGAVAHRNRVYFYGFNEPAALIIITDDRRNPNWMKNGSCAAENMMLAAHSLGLGSVWINVLSDICDEPEIRALLDSLDIPQNHSVIATLAIGWPKEAGKLPTKKQDVVCWAE